MSDDKLLSVTTRTSLSDQRAKSFSDLNVKNYPDIKANLQDADSFTISVNSSAKLGNLDDDELRYYILYIDEISPFA